MDAELNSLSNGDIFEGRGCHPKSQSEYQQDILESAANFSYVTTKQSISNFADKYYQVTMYTSTNDQFHE